MLYSKRTNLLQHSLVSDTKFVQAFYRVMDATIWEGTKIGISQIQPLSPLLQPCLTSMLVMLVMLLAHTFPILLHRAKLMWKK